jgi:hypothetical protein
MNYKDLNGSKVIILKYKNGMDTVEVRDKGDILERR